MIALVSDLCRGGTHTDRSVGTNETDHRKVGDVIYAALYDATFGIQEKAEHLIVLHSDPNLELAIIAAGGIKPQPFAIYELDENGVSQCINRSSYRVDISKYTGSPGLDINDTTAEPVPPISGTINEDYSVQADLIFDDTAR